MQGRCIQDAKHAYSKPGYWNHKADGKPNGLRCAQQCNAIPHLPLVYSYTVRETPCAVHPELVDIKPSVESLPTLVSILHCLVTQVYWFT